MGGDDIAEGEAILNASGVPTFQYPDEAARSFCYMWRYSDNLRALYETPALGADEFDIGLRSDTKRGDDSGHPKSQSYPVDRA